MYLKQIIPLKHPVKEFNCFNIGTVSGHNYGSPIQTAGNRKMLKKKVNIDQSGLKHHFKRP